MRTPFASGCPPAGRGIARIDSKYKRRSLRSKSREGTARDEGISGPTTRLATPELPAVRRAAAGVEEQHFRLATESPGREQLLAHGEGATAFGSRVDAAGARQSQRRVANLLLVRGRRVPVALAQRAQDEPVAERAGDPAAAGVRLRSLPGRGTP